MAAHIELPDFVTGARIERAYRRMLDLQNHAREPWWNGGHRARRLKTIGVKMAIDRNPRMLLFLEKMAEYLRARNDEQVSRFAQEGYTKTDFGEFAMVREAFIKATEPNRDEAALHTIFCWVYAAVAEALGE